MLRAARGTIAVLLAVTALAACQKAQANWSDGVSATPSEHGVGTAPQAAPSATASAAAGCAGMPADSIWRADVSKLPVHKQSAAFVASIGASTGLHPDFGAGLWEGAPIGIPITTVQPGQAGVKVTFQYAKESDPGLYPVPADARIEGGPTSKGDRHVILHDPAACKVFELYAAYPAGGGAWRAGSGAVFDLRSNNLRPAGWTSADAAGLSIWAGLIRYAEVVDGKIDHAIRVTVPRSRNAYVWPARHAASELGDAALPPMGLRLRLKASVVVSKLPAQARVIAEAMKKYGVIVADNGSPWYLSGEPDDRWSNDALRALKGLHGSDFEAVDSSGLMVSPDSGSVNLTQAQ